ncbi:Protein Cornichon-like 1, partial [Manis pentadactyla]
ILESGTTFNSRLNPRPAYRVWKCQRKPYEEGTGLYQREAWCTNGSLKGPSTVVAITRQLVQEEALV